MMAGYSQGGRLVHNAAPPLAAALNQVSSVVIFGDPDHPAPVEGVPAS